MEGRADRWRHVLVTAEGGDCLVHMTRVEDVEQYQEVEAPHGGMLEESRYAEAPGVVIAEQGTELMEQALELLAQHRGWERFPVMT